MYYFIGRKLDAKILQPPAVFNLPVAMVAYLKFDLEYQEGLYYCKLDVFTNGHDPIYIQCNRIIAPANPKVRQTPSKFTPTSKVRQVESEVWML
jgi:hypothetical protein